MDSLEHYILEASRQSISAHNVQPFRLRIHGKYIEIWLDGERCLPFADPNGKDLEMAAGALFETLRLSLGERDIDLVVVETNFPKDVAATPFRKLALLKMVEDRGQQDPLFAQLKRRYSYRGGFRTADKAGEIPTEIAVGELQLRFLSDPARKKEIAKLYDSVNLHFLSQPGYVEELYSWLRFSNDHTRWDKDGLNTEAMALSDFEGRAAAMALKPGVFSLLNKVGAAGLLVSEKPKIVSAHGVVALVGPQTSAFEAGRQFLRGWLKLTSMNLFGAPLSLLTDDPVAIHKTRELFDVESGRQIYNILRVGFLQQDKRAVPPARRPVEEIRLPDGIA